MFIFASVLAMTVFQNCADPGKKDSDSYSIGSCFDPSDFDLMSCQNVCPGLWAYIKEEQLNYFESEQECTTHFNLNNL
jgi:hypothetical protein